VDKDATLLDLKKRIYKILHPHEPEDTGETDVPSLRLWHPASWYRKANELKEFMETRGIAADMEMPEETDPDFEMNSGVDFPGDLLDLSLEELVDRRTSYYINEDMLVFEQSTSTGLFIFKRVRNLDRIKKCDWCNQYKPYEVSCPCGTVFYCCQEHMDSDERYHQQTCKIMD